MESRNIVKAWEERIKLPTYGTGKPEKNPIFSDKRVYQGSSGVVYPHPVVEKILDEKTDKEYTALFLENPYVKIMILPELGGRIQMAYDKMRNRHFVYYNQVIKPALVGLTGPWISGGIEFNWPQHHRPSTFSPLDYTIEEHADGSKTVWVSEVERMFRTKGMAGFRLYPDRAYLEINGRVYNRTHFPQTFLWWANPAVKVNDDYQSVFPPDVHAVFDHGKRDVSAFPIAKGKYYKVDYSAGVDISRYKNIPVPTSYMAIQSKYDFIGGYEHDTKAGLLHVASHHISPGKKQWTWGKGEFGFAWDRNLTDEDGPYIELMTGVFTDNQPDFSWIQPNEEKKFTQYFMPYSELGAIKNATKDAFVNMEVSGNEVDIRLYTTAVQNNALIMLTHGGDVLWQEHIDIMPEKPFLKIITAANISSEKLRIALYDQHGKVLVQYQPELKTAQHIPDAAKPAKDPKDIASIEQLFLTGLHLEQYRHATYNPTDYYREALKREPGDIRNNNAMGLWLLRRGKFADSEKYFRQAIATLTERNPNPYDGEPYYNLGVCLACCERFEEAFDAFYKSTWNAAWQHAAFLNLARIACRNRNWDDAMELIDQSINGNFRSLNARHVKAIILRKTQRNKEALTLIDESLGLDRFNVGCLFERYLIYRQSADEVAASETLSSMKKISRQDIHSHIEYGLDYYHAGCFEEACMMLEMLIYPGRATYPMVQYYIGFFHEKNNQSEKAIAYYKKAAAQPSDYCFPNRIEDVAVLQSALSLNAQDSKAPYYLGNFWYANRQYDEAIASWEKSRELDDAFPTVHRNLALAYHNKRSRQDLALESLERAFERDQTDARVLMELDQLYKKLNKAHAERLTILEKFIDLTEDRDDLYLERVALYNHLGEHRKALELIMARRFHPWEGGEGKVVGQYLTCHIELAKEALIEERPTEALEYLGAIETYPFNLGEGKLYGAQENDVCYLKGLAIEMMGDSHEAQHWYTKATVGLTEPVQAVYYNDQQPDKIFYQGLAWRKLSDNNKAERIFDRLISFGKQHLDDNVRIDYFAVSLPDLLVFDQDLNLRNKIHCHYLMALGHMGKGLMAEAEEHFNFVLTHDISHMGACLHKKMMDASRYFF